MSIESFTKVVLYPGAKRGRFTLIRKIKVKKNFYWLCRCECGKEKEVNRNYLYREKASCGCLLREMARKLNRVSGLSSHKLYPVYAGMVSRCTNPNSKFASHYLKRGITVCSRWLGHNGPANFFEDMGDRPPGTSLDRIDNNKGYEPGNCRWTTSKQQNRNKRNNRLITFKGETATLAEWSERTWLKPVTISARLKKGWPLEEAITRAPTGRISSTKRKTHCPSGHPYDKLNTRYQASGARICKECDRLSHRKKRQSTRGE